MDFKQAKRNKKWDSWVAIILLFSFLLGYCPYEWLKKITNGFNETPVVDGGNLIGVGGFSKVYLGKLTLQFET